MNVPAVLPEALEGIAAVRFESLNKRRLLNFPAAY